VPSGPTARPFRFGEQHRPDPDPALGPGSLVGDRYRIVRLLGEGGMGRVYEAEHTFLGRRVALKLLRRDALAQPENVKRFEQEARAASTIGHRAIVEVVDFATLPDGRVFMVMELLGGESLEAWMGRPGRLSEVVPLLAEVAQGLEAAHRAGVIHRDIKPANLFLSRTSDGSVHAKILDFGIAKVTDRPTKDFQTEAGSVLGTPYYLAPERAMGRPTDHRADLYSLGVILYELSTGNVPFDAESFMEILARHVKSTPLDPRQAAPDRTIPDALARLTMRLLEKDPGDRPAGAGEVASELLRIARDDADALARGVTGPRVASSSGGDATHVLGDLSARPTTVPLVAGPMLSFAGGAVVGAPSESVAATSAELPAPTRSRAPIVLVAAFVAVGAVGGLIYLELAGGKAASATPTPGPASQPVPEQAPRSADPDPATPPPTAAAPDPAPVAAATETKTPVRDRARPRGKPRKAAAPEPVAATTTGTAPGPTIKDDIYDE
jgi:serine/threonine-protein kinase